MSAPNRLAELRKAKDMSQIALSQAVGVNPSTIWRWEVGKIVIPDDKKLALAALLEVTPAALMGWPEEVAA